MLKPSFLFSLGLITIISGYGCNSEFLQQNATGNLAGSFSTEATTQQDIDRPKYDKANIYAACESFKKRHGGTFTNRLFCLPAAEDKYFFFVIKGEYDFRNLDKNVANKYDIGIVDQDGKMIIPMEMDAVNNLGATIDGYWEVRKGNKYGLYDATGKLAIPVEMDAIYPYAGSSEVLAQVRRGKDFGWADKKGAVHFEKDSNKDAALFKFPVISKLISTWKYDSDNKNLHFFLSIENIEENLVDVELGCGVIYTPSYLFKLGILPEVQAFFNLYGPSDGGIDKSTASIDKVEDLGGNTKGFFATFFESGISGRDYQYDQKVLTTVNEQLEQLGNLKTVKPNTWTCGEELSFRFLNPSLIEVKKNITDDYEHEIYYTEMTSYSYHSVDAKGAITELKSNRTFPFTKYVKIDETYFTGCYVRIFEEGSDPKAPQDNNAIRTSHLSIEDLDVMRNEIFAEYGYKFTTDKWSKYFSAKSWYKATNDNVDAMLSEIDKANIAVILKMKDKLKKDEAKYLNKEYAMYHPAG